MSEMVMILPVMALTAIVLVGILVVFRKYLAIRDKLDAEFAQTPPTNIRRSGEAPRAAVPARKPPQIIRHAEPQRHAA